jgi:ATP-dependent exoDNAse (exonuclease V) beta subunit
MKQHISYSELKTWAECSWRHKLQYIDGLNPFQGNEFTTFGTALHAVSEKFLVDETAKNPEQYFETQFLNELKSLKSKDKDLVLNASLIQEMRSQGTSLAPQIIPSLKEHFEDYEIISVEEMLYEPIEDKDFNFKGFIDVVIKKGDVYHIIDWKSCSWGWNQNKKRDQLITYQLTLYKAFFAKKHNIDPKQIKTHFGLLKRTAKSNQIEIFEVSAGTKKTENALNLMNKALYNIFNKRFIKNKLSCKYCPFDGTQHCKK